MWNRGVHISVPMPWGSIAGKTFGEEKAIPVLCVHGRSDNLETFSFLIPLLPHNQYYVCIDLPGHGKSIHAGKGYILDLVWYTMCVKRVIDHFKWTTLYFVGHSFGGQIGCLISALYPELVLKLIVIDTLFYNHNNASATVTNLRNNVFDPILKLEKRSSLDDAPTYSFIEFVEKMKRARMTEVNDEQLRSIAERNLIKIGPDQYKFSNDQRIKVINDPPFNLEQLENIASKICCPTLVILGKNSTVTRPKSLMTRTPLKKSNSISFKIIEGDHDIHLAHPEQVAHLVKTFLFGEIASKL